MGRPNPNVLRCFLRRPNVLPVVLSNSRAYRTPLRVWSFVIISRFPIQTENSPTSWNCAFPAQGAFLPPFGREKNIVESILMQEKNNNNVIIAKSLKKIIIKNSSMKVRYYFMELLWISCGSNQSRWPFKLSIYIIWMILFHEEQMM